jgi:hydroxymethylglutaryl-CoA reductase
VVEALIESGDIKVWKARDIVASLVSNEPAPSDEAEPRSSACGKMILLGEHAVVYGRQAIAAPIPLAVEARVKDSKDGIQMVIPRWGVEQRIRSLEEHPQGVAGILAMVLKELKLESRSMEIEVFPHIPRAMGLGGSSALAVAVIRALDTHFGVGLDAEQVNALAFECEKAAHGTPSGVDNTVATYGKPLLYHRDEGPVFTELEIATPMTFVIGISGRESLTATHVARVRESWERQTDRYESLFDEIDALTTSAVGAIATGNHGELGELMNLCHGLLNALQLSTPELEELAYIARSNGALGAKLTGGGGGGSIIALAPDEPQRVIDAIQAAGYQALEVSVG